MLVYALPTMSLLPIGTELLVQLIYFQFVGTWWQLFLTFVLEMWIKLHASIGETLGTKAEQVSCTVLPSHCSALLRGEERTQPSLHPLTGKEWFLWKTSTRELRNLNSESLKNFSGNENLKHRQIKGPCPKPVQEIVSEMDIESSDHQTQDFFFFFLTWGTRKYKPFPHHQKFHKAGPLMTMLQSTILRT